MSSETAYKIKVFLATFFIALAVFGGMFALSYFFLPVDDVPADQAVSNVPIQEHYAPNPEDDLSLVLIGCKEYTQPPSFLFLLKFNVVTNRCNLVELPVNTLSQADGKQKTLYEHYEYGGSELTAKASENLLALSKSQYLRIDYEGLKLLSDYFGGLLYSVPEEIITEEYRFLPGRQLLDGSRFSSLLFSPAFPDKADLLTLFLGEHFQYGMIDKLDRFYNTLFEASDTSLNRMLFNQLDKPIRIFLQNENPKFFPHTLSGTLSEEGFLPNPEQLDKLQDLFSEQEIT